MMLGLNGRHSGVDVFAFHLAEKLGVFVSSLDDMSHAEYVRWNAYFTAKSAIENQR